MSYPLIWESEFQTRGKGNFRRCDYQRKRILKNYSSSKILLKLRKWVLPKSFLPPPKLCACLQALQKEACSDICEEQGHSADPLGLHGICRPLLDTYESGGKALPLVCLCPNQRHWGNFHCGCYCCFWVTHLCVGREELMHCLEPAHSASCSSADDELQVSFATAQVSAKTQGCVSF